MSESHVGWLVVKVKVSNLRACVLVFYVWQLARSVRKYVKEADNNGTNRESGTVLIGQVIEWLEMIFGEVIYSVLSPQNIVEVPFTIMDGIRV